jgi:hypothetical protein
MVRQLWPGVAEFDENFSADQQNDTSATRTTVEGTAMRKKVSNLEAAQTGRQFC